MANELIGVLIEVAIGRGAIFSQLLINRVEVDAYAFDVLLYVVVCFPHSALVADGMGCLFYSQGIGAVLAMLCGGITKINRHIAFQFILCYARYNRTVTRIFEVGLVAMIYKAATENISGDEVTGSAGSGFENNRIACCHISLCPRVDVVPVAVPQAAILARVLGIFINNMVRNGVRIGLIVTGSLPNLLGISEQGFGVDTFPIN